MRILGKSLLAPAATLVAAAPVLAESGSKLDALQRQLTTLQARVAALEAQRSFTQFIPDFAERFQVMHRAGKAGDRVVASHELSEMKRLAALSSSIDGKKSKLLIGMMEPNFEALGEAIERSDEKVFGAALERTVDTCNACHAATGSGFSQVTIDASEAISIRHSYRLAERKALHGPTHGMHGHGADEDGHDDGNHHPRPEGMGSGMMGNGAGRRMPRSMD